MKNAMKKLMSLVLVAVLLVSAVPFAVSADETCTKDFNCQHTGDHHIAGCPKIPCNPAACDHGGYSHLPECPKACNGQLDCAQFAAGNTAAEYHKAGCLAISKASEPITNGTECTNSYECKHVGNNHVAGCPMIPCSNDATCDHGGWNHLETCPYACKNSSSCHAWYHLDTCPVAKAEEDNDSSNTGSNNSNNSGNNGSYNENLYKPVFLDVYMNGNAQTYVKRYDITKTIAADGIVSWKDIYDNVILKNFTAKTSAGISMDGPYLDTINGGNWESSWTYNGGVQQDIAGLNEMRAKGTVIIDVMIYNANANGSATADSSNPKTGDMIFAPIAVMTVSASALALFFFLNKKRAI